MIIGGSKFYFINKKDHFDHYRIGLYLPYLSIARGKDCDGDTRSVKLEAKTSIGLIISAIHWDLQFIVLGFGMQIYRQWSY